MNTSKLSDKRKHEIVDAAARLFEEKGIDDTKVSDIVQELDVAQGLFYYYFKSKKDIVTAVAAKYANEIEEQASRLCSSAHDFISWSVNIIKCYFEKSAMLLRGKKKCGKLTAVAISNLEKFAAEMINKIISKGVSAGVIKTKRPIETGSVVFYGLKELYKQSPGSVDLVVCTEILENIFYESGDKKGSL